MDKSRMAFSLKEGARIVGLGDRKFHQEVLDGKIDVVKIGKRRLVTMAALSAYLEKNTVRAFDPTNEAQQILEKQKIPSAKTKMKQITTNKKNTAEI